METTDREKDVLKLANAILNMSPKYYDNPNGGVEHSCPLCFETEVTGYNSSVEIKDINHSKDCAYLIAKDLTAGLKLNTKEVKQ